jgi:hypothetical protein
MSEAKTDYPAVKLPTMFTKAIKDVLAEREHQIVDLGYGSDHDDEHAANELPQAAGAYMMNVAARLHPGDGTGYIEPPPWWPWDAIFWKPKTVRDDLVRAVALGLAAIEKMDREATA